MKISACISQRTRPVAAPGRILRAGALSLIVPALLFCGLAAAEDLPPLPQRYALIIVGISGDEPHYEKFWAVGSGLFYALRDRCGYDKDKIYFLFEEKPPTQDIIYATSTKKNIEAVFGELKKKLRKQDHFFLFVAGHADYNGRNVRVHLPGRDITGEELAALLDSLPTNNILSVITTPVSGYFMRRLSKPGRITITATKVGAEISETVFPHCFVKAFEDEIADADADGLLSIKEIFEYTQEKVLDFFLEKNLIETEHSMLDDDGDGVGTRELKDDSPDGKKAAREYFPLKVEG